MSAVFPQILIETIVRKAIRDIRDSPKRSTRNLIDMALNFSEGRFQSRFFEPAQSILRDENRAYYRLIPDMAVHVDTEKIIHFGINLGYNSCTAGAKKIGALVGAKVNLPAMWVLAAITIGGSVAGPLGMLLGVPAMSAFYSLLQEATEKRERRMGE